jgi:hypothetical protein
MHLTNSLKTSIALVLFLAFLISTLPAFAARTDGSHSNTTESTSSSGTFIGDFNNDRWS